MKYEFKIILYFFNKLKKYKFFILLYTFIITIKLQSNK